MPSTYPTSMTSGSDHWSFYATLQSGKANQAPTIDAAASATPSPVYATITNLAVLGADDGGEANLTYTWATIDTPPATVTFSTNGTNAAKNVTATFAKSGSYSFQVTIKDQGNLSVTSSVNVTVSQALTAINDTPTTASIASNAQQQFLALALDQYGSPVSPQPSFSWTVSSGGTISSSVCSRPVTRLAVPSQ